MENENELEPCPFCGGEARVVSDEKSPRFSYKVVCRCGVGLTTWQGAAYAARDIWNTRPAIKALRDENKKMQCCA